MRKLLESFKFEVGIFVIGVLIVLVLPLVKKFWGVDVTASFEIGLATAVALVPLALARIESIVREDRRESLSAMKDTFAEAFETIAKNLKASGQDIERTLEFCQAKADQELIARRRELAVSSAFIASLESAFKHAPDCVNVLKQMEPLVRDVTEGRYPIADADAIYNHDSERINLLRGNDFYWATWSAAANPDSFASNNNPISIAYRSYIRSQEAAAARGVNVVRLYIVPNPEDIPEWLSSHLRELRGKGVQIRLVSADLLRNNSHCEDFVIIGSRVVGVGDPPRGKMERSVYFFNPWGQEREEYRDYKNFFEQLRDNGREVV